MTSRTMIADHSGKIFYETRGSLKSVNWRLNQVGQARMEEPVDDLFRRGVARVGNKVLVQFDNGLPNWGGVIRRGGIEWTPNKVKLTANSAEHLLTLLATGKTLEFDGLTPGEMLVKLLDVANDQTEFTIKEGSVHKGGPTFGLELHVDTIGDVIKNEVAAALAGEWWIDAERKEFRIIFTVHMRPGERRVLQGVGLVQYKNALVRRVQEQGPIANEWQVAGGVRGGGSDWGDNRLYTTARDQESVNLNGLRQRTKIMSNIKNERALQAAADALLEKSKKRRLKVDLEVTNKQPALFGDYRVGDVLRVVLPDITPDGVDAYMQIMSREYAVGEGKCRVIAVEA